MNIKSLLLGSAAAMVAVSGASAADAIIAEEPEPVEYVRVCDAFGSGYFYIPGTETCLKLSGNVRMRLIAEDEADSYETKVRARLAVQAKSDTEWGELHSYIRFSAENESTAQSADFGMNLAYIAVAGFHVGRDESAWAYSTNGGLSGFGAHGIYGGDYGFLEANMIQYQFGGGNWFGAVSLEDDGDTTTWTPDVIGRLGGVVGGITVFGVVGFDQSNTPGSSEWGAKLGLNADIGSAGNLRVQGFYASGATSYGANYTGLGSVKFTPEWSVLASYEHDVGSDVALYVSGQYYADFYNGTTGVQTSADGWRVAGGFNWTPVENLSFGLAGYYYDVDAAVSGDVDWQVLGQVVRSF